ncbi:MAG: alanine racemase [Acidimicrobiia bacterium]
MRPSWAEIDLRAVAHNVAAFRSHLGDTALCAVVKADAYGHGDVPVAETAVDNGAAWLAVALLEEGIRLREADITAPILLLSEPAVADASMVAEWDLTPTVYRPVFLEALADFRDRVGPIHLKIDTGMHRAGADLMTITALAHQAKTLGFGVGGIWTHFAASESDPGFTEIQVALLEHAVEHLSSVIGPDAIVHHSNTGAAILRGGGDMARVGLGLYGLYPSDRCRPLIDLRPAMRIVSHVSHVRRHAAGARPSYGRRRPLASDSTVATVPIGYADGVPRLLSDEGTVLIGGSRRPLAGTVTMDQLVVDCGDDRVEVGDEVVLIGRQGESEITADEWAALTGTINYEIVCGVGPRLPRRFIE